MVGGRGPIRGGGVDELVSTVGGLGDGLGFATTGVGESTGLCFGVGVLVGVFAGALKLKLKL